MSNTVDHPQHYTSSPAKCRKCGHGIECIDVAEHMGFCLGNAIKYIWRADLKGATVEDLKKAVWYINREISNRVKPDIEVGDTVELIDHPGRGFVVTGVSGDEIWADFSGAGYPSVMSINAVRPV